MAGSQLRKTGAVAVGELELTGVLAVHQLRRVVDMVESEHMRKLVDHDRFHLLPPTRVLKHQRHVRCVEHRLTGDVDNRFPRPLRDLAASQASDVTGKFGHFCGTRPRDEHRRPALAVQFGLIGVAVAGAGRFTGRTIENECQARRCSNFGDRFLDDSVCTRRCEVRADHIVDWTARVIGDEFLPQVFVGKHRVLCGPGRWRGRTQWGICCLHSARGDIRPRQVGSQVWKDRAFEERGRKIKRSNTSDQRSGAQTELESG